MKQYVIDELRYEDHEKIKAYLDENYQLSRIEGIYWIPIDEELLSEVQTQHRECQPFYFALNLEQNYLACELLVRASEKIRCNCICYANEKQRNWLIALIDAILEKMDAR